MELKVNEVAIPERITFNFEELKAELTEKVQIYSTIAYTDDKIKEAKADRANLNKLKKAINDERIRREREYMAPFNTFKAQVDEILAIIDEPIRIIDAQVKESERKAKEAKEKGICEYLSQVELPYGIEAEKLWNPKWLNASVSHAAIASEINTRAAQIREDVKTLEELQEYQDYAIQCYKETLDLRQALGEAKRQKKWAEARTKIEAERKAAEEARKAAEEARKAEELARPKEEPKPEPVQTAHPEPPKVEAKRWITLDICLTVPQMHELAAWFKARDIENHLHKEG